MKRALPAVDVDYLERIVADAFEVRVAYYLDLDTGTVLAVPDEVFDAVEEGETEFLHIAHRSVVPVVEDINENPAKYTLVPKMSLSDVESVLVRFLEDVDDEVAAGDLVEVLMTDSVEGCVRLLSEEYPELDGMFSIMLADFASERVSRWLSELGVRKP